MVSRMLTMLNPVRVTVGYAVALVAVGTTLVALGPRVHDAVIDHMSTNLHNLVHGHLGTLLGSAFVVSAGPMWVWLPGLTCLLAAAELLWRGRRLLLTFVLGHIGATLIVAAGLGVAIWFGWLPVSVAHASDVGISYGAAAVLGTLTAAVPARWRPALVGWWVAVGVVVIAVDRDFTDVGHIVALSLGMVLSTRFHRQVRWTPLRFVLLLIGVSFGYMMLVNTGLTALIAPVAGLVGAIAVHRAVRVWRRRYVGGTPEVEPPVDQQPVLEREPLLQA
jgi:hypothetical protein